MTSYTFAFWSSHLKTNQKDSKIVLHVKMTTKKTLIYGDVQGDTKTKDFGSDRVHAWSQYQACDNENTGFNDVK